ncbi:MAG TPA: SAM-dependent methyltransferase, partial [Ilumatobacteraceae bacterium]
LVIVGAGLDGRAWRMADLAAVDVFEVDHPASQADKRARVGGLSPTARSISFVPIDLARESLTAALRSAGHDPGVATTWIWEGVIPYLTRAQVESSLAHIAACSAPHSTLVANYQSPSLRASLGRVAGTALARLARRSNPLAREPWRSMWRPADIDALLRRHGFAAKSDEDLATVSRRLEFDPRHTRSLAQGRVAVATHERA